ncbi:S-adenosylmethionine decarboxylase [Candidatus Micrarchaeota archaeon]|nr:S-adenosylmethionine decarboxylase [Candidatus Micrarchaeota archaeon]
MTVNARIDPNFKALPKDDAQRFVNELMKTIHMKPLGPLNWSDAEDLDFPGQSFVQMITTSHCSVHYFTGNDGTNEIHFDLYSCTCFDVNKVIALLDRTFGLISWHGIIYQRTMHEAPVVKMIGSEAKEVLVETPSAAKRC